MRPPHRVLLVAVLSAANCVALLGLATESQTDQRFPLFGLSSKSIVVDRISVPDIGPLPASTPAPTGSGRHAAKIELGRQLFFEGRLSRNNQVSCAYCHIPGSGFSDPHPHHSV
jgi:cytochrome c peroxidase